MRGAALPAATGRLVALRSRDFRLLLAGQLVSLTGTQMQQVAVLWQLRAGVKPPRARVVSAGRAA